ncbi:hypothetical protein FP74_gp048 [Bacillus phage CAM003]|uniref:Uncharacterized protein n=3 Tax=Bastillevirus TaxID=1918010 RepID=A0A024AZK5_9CAUD|nr:hypothetical protein FP76_gp050 [Bacillus phage Evoli]YP_009036951.1 hypothetical protein FP74_gp048 [Bacillus phage CAM003]AMW61802.1 hypothetical protein DNAM5_51 [Bacillus phage Vinny]ASR79487.1 hypothetical protein OTK52_49 [Bacillus phage OTooleKemple52]AXQ67266.1 hypothetical protein KAMFAM_51 [Bacillus phage Kamfam]AHZ09485.1 hypothetical protein [Bacillus phage CAM003]AHZ09774.1 hypothetical protein [Bacillus phage Evoli]
MTDFEREILSMHAWLMRRTEIREDGTKRTNPTHVKEFLKDFHKTVEKYEKELVK